MGWREFMAGPAAQETDGDDEGSPYAGPPVKSTPRGERATGKANRLAVTALICATAVPFLLVGGVLGAVFGFVALDEIEESEGKERGRGMAQWAIGLGFLNIVLSCAVIALLSQQLLELASSAPN